MNRSYKHQHEGYGFSENGHKAYLNGEKPLVLWKQSEKNLEIVKLIATKEHHIQKILHGARLPFKKKLVMFYKKW